LVFLLVFFLRLDRLVLVARNPFDLHLLHDVALLLWLLLLRRLVRERRFDHLAVVGERGGARVGVVVEPHRGDDQRGGERARGEHRQRVHLDVLERHIYLDAPGTSSPWSSLPRSSWLDGSV